jgi:hypothetical protein
MKLTHRIADWLTGGKFSARQISIEAWMQIAQEMEQERNDAQNHILAEAGWRDRACDVADELVRAQASLDRIAAMETPGANATVKRMARVARGEE